MTLRDVNQSRIIGHFNTIVLNLVIVSCLVSSVHATSKVVRNDMIHDQHSGLCPDVVVAGNGNIIVSFSTNGSGDVNPGQRGALVRSTDGGITWSDIIQLFKADDETTQGVYLSGFLKRSSDDALLMVATSIADPDKTMRNRKTAKIQVMISRDNGITFSPLAILEVHGQYLSAPYGNMVELPDGNIILPGFIEHVGNGYWLSKDRGLNWTPFIKVWNDPPEGAKQELAFNETSYIVCKNNDVVSIARNDRDKIFYLIRSKDSGKSWSDPKAIPLMGGSPALHKASNGDLLFACRDAARPGINIYVSPDNGLHWRFGYLLSIPEGVAKVKASHWNRPKDKQHWQPLEGYYGYPGFADLPNGDIYAVWSANNRASKFPKGHQPYNVVGNLIKQNSEKTSLKKGTVFTAAQIGTLLRGQKRTGAPALTNLISNKEGLGLEITGLRIEDRTSTDMEVNDFEDHMFYVIDGKATFYVDDKTGKTEDQEQTENIIASQNDIVGAGDMIVIPRGTAYRINCPDGFLEVLVIKKTDTPVKKK